MFIRRTPTRSNATGEHYFTYRLVRSKRIGDKVRQVVLLNLGRHFAVERDDWPALCLRIEEIVHGQMTCMEIDLPPAVAATAQRLAAQLLARQAETPVGSAANATAAADLQTVDVDSLNFLQPRSVGVEQVGLWAMRQVGFVEHLVELGISGPLRAAILGSIIGRMAAPDSEAATHRWLCDQSALGELLEVDFGAMRPMTLYRASDCLMRHRAVIEQRLFDRVHDLFGFSTTVTLYDLTNTYFEGTAAANPKAKRGRSKEKRSDCPLVTLGLVLDGSGFVRRSETFEGSAAEAPTLEGMLTGLGAPPGALVVMDAGIATEANLAWLRGQGYRYLVVSRERGRQFDPAGAIPIQTASGATVTLQRVDDPEGEEVRLYCHSEQRQQKEEGINERFCQRFEAGLQKIADGLRSPRAEKRLDRLHERIGRLREKSRGVGTHYAIELIPDERGEKAIELRWERRPKAGTRLTHPGIYCLRSNQTDWDAERLWRTYTMLTDLEAVFRSLKNELGLRPVFHHQEGRVDGHLFITILAYQFVQILRRHWKEKEITGRWSTLREILGGQRRVTASFLRADGGALHVRKATRPEPELLALYKALALDPLPGGVQKTYV
jgi:hypothetical protein